MQDWQTIRPGDWVLEGWGNLAPVREVFSSQADCLEAGENINSGTCRLPTEDELKGQIPPWPDWLGHPEKDLTHYDPGPPVDPPDGYTGPGSMVSP